MFLSKAGFPNIGVLSLTEQLLNRRKRNILVEGLGKKCLEAQFMPMIFGNVMLFFFFKYKTEIIFGLAALQFEQNALETAQDK